MSFDILYLDYFKFQFPISPGKKINSNHHKIIVQEACRLQMFGLAQTFISFYF